MNMNFEMTTKIITGKDCVCENSSLFGNFGKKCIVITGKKSADLCGAFDDVVNALEKMQIEYIRFDEIRQNPTLSSCRAAAEKAISFGADFVVGIGGGSPLDAAKAVAMLVKNPKISEEDIFSSNFSEALPIIAVGTTAGSGSEVTPVAIICDKNDCKKSMRSEKIYPSLCFGDAKYTLSLPQSFTRSTALDALCHCVEAYFNRSSNEINRTFAIRGVEILSQMLEITATDKVLKFSDREKLYFASIYGGLAICVSGTAFPHGMGYFLTERFGVAHGDACAVYLCEFINHNEIAEPEITDEFFKRAGISKEKLMELVKKNLPDFKIKLSNDEICEILPRFYNNKSFLKTYGTCDVVFAENLLKKLFS